MRLDKWLWCARFFNYYIPHDIFIPRQKPYLKYTVEGPLYHIAALYPHRAVKCYERAAEVRR